MTVHDGADPWVTGRALEHAFQHPDLLRQALVHRSYLFDHPQAAPGHNERLEFLGDAVVQLAVSQWLFERFPGSPEGELTRLRAQLVSRTSLAQMACDHALDRALRLGKAAEVEGARQHQRLLAAAFEAVVGAIFLDGGWEAAYRAVRHCVELQCRRWDPSREANPKGALQEWLARRGRPGPVYQLVEVAGAPHRRRFTAQVLVEGVVTGAGRGRSRKEAEQEAARVALAALTGGMRPAREKEFPTRAE